MRYWIITIVLVLVIVIGAFTFMNRKPASQGQNVSVESPADGVSASDKISSSPP